MSSAQLLGQKMFKKIRNRVNSQKGRIRTTNGWSGMFFKDKEKLFKATQKQNFMMKTLFFKKINLKNTKNINIKK